MSRDDTRNVAKELAQAEAAVIDNPANPEALQRVGEAYIRSGRLKDARAALNLAITEDPTDPWSHLYLGNAFYAEGCYAEALDAFLHGQLLAPDLAISCICLADTYHAMGDLKKADSQYNRAVELEPDDPGAVGNLVRWRAIKGDA